MDFSAFDTKKMDEYAAQAKASWGETSEYHEFERKSQARSKEEENALVQQMMAIFAEMAAEISDQPLGKKTGSQSLTDVPGNRKLAMTGKLVNES